MTTGSAAVAMADLSFLRSQVRTPYSQPQHEVPRDNTCEANIYSWVTYPPDPHAPFFWHRHADVGQTVPDRALGGESGLARKYARNTRGQAIRGRHRRRAILCGPEPFDYNFASFPGRGAAAV